MQKGVVGTFTALVVSVSVEVTGQTLQTLREISVTFLSDLRNVAVRLVSSPIVISKIYSF